AVVARYWTLPQSCEADEAVSHERLCDELRDAVRTSVRLRMRSDVPLGLFLSGGVDSGIIAACMARAARSAGGATAEIRTFTVGFGEKDYDEVKAASAVARALGAEHHEIVLHPTPRETLDLLPDLAGRLDQPFADSSALAMHHLSREVRRHVTVALS